MAKLATTIIRVNAHSGLKQPYSFNEILQVKAKWVNYLKENSEKSNTNNSFEFRSRSQLLEEL